LLRIARYKKEKIYLHSSSICSSVYKFRFFFN